MVRPYQSTAADEYDLDVSINDIQGCDIEGEVVRSGPNHLKVSRIANRNVGIQHQVAITIRRSY